MTMNQPRAINSPPSIFRAGHRAITGLMDGEITVQEKIDGSQFSFMRTNLDDLLFRSRKHMVVAGEVGLFNRAIEEITKIKPFLEVGVIYRSECVDKAKHNVLAYGRTPKCHVVIYDMQRPDGTYYNTAGLVKECAKLGLENVATFYRGPASAVTEQMATSWLAKESQLGATLVEGYVIKNYEKLTAVETKPMMSKVVAQRFEEKQGGKRPPGPDIMSVLETTYRTEARWRKAIQHLTEQGKLVGEMSDLKHLIPEIQLDVLGEHVDDIKQALFEHFWHRLRKRLVSGFPDFYAANMAEVPVE